MVFGLELACGRVGKDRPTCLFSLLVVLGMRLFHVAVGDLPQVIDSVEELVLGSRVVHYGLVPHGLGTQVYFVLRLGLHLVLIIFWVASPQAVLFSLCQVVERALFILDDLVV